MIELLIVVAIIGILAALLLPALKSARDKGYSITCLSNMKQVGLGSAQYTGDNDDWLVPNWNGLEASEYDGNRYERHWYGLLCGLPKDPPNLVIAWNTPGPYGLTWGITGVAQPKRKGQFSCPAEPELLYWAGHKTDTHLNSFLHGGLINRGDMPGGPGRKSNQIISPSLAVSFFRGSSERSGVSFRGGLERRPPPGKPFSTGGTTEAPPLSFLTDTGPWFEKRRPCPFPPTALPTGC